MCCVINKEVKRVQDKSAINIQYYRKLNFPRVPSGFKNSGITNFRDMITKYKFPFKFSLFRTLCLLSLSVSLLLPFLYRLGPSCSWRACFFSSFNFADRWSLSLEIQTSDNYINMNGKR